MKPDIRCRATLRLLAGDDGGRQNAILSGYRGRFMPDIDEAAIQEDYYAQTDVLGSAIDPGREGEVEIVVGINGCVPAIWPGLGFAIREGARVIARGTVTEVLGPVDDA